MSDQSRRKLLKSIAAGSGAFVAGKNLPETWSRPIVDSVLLPAHAQTSPPPCSPVGSWADSGDLTGNFIISADGTLEVTFGLILLNGTWTSSGAGVFMEIVNSPPASSEETFLLYDLTMSADCNSMSGSYYFSYDTTLRPVELIRV